MLAAPVEISATTMTPGHQPVMLREVLELLAEGLGNRQLAAALGISENTVKFHLSSVFSKLGVGSRTEAVVSSLPTAVLPVKLLALTPGCSTRAWPTPSSGTAITKCGGGR